MTEQRVDFRQFILSQGLFLAWIIALIATLGSLYFSEIVGYIPCELCWVQRIFMYPLVVMLTIAILRKDNNISVYIIPLSSLGVATSLFHYAQQQGLFNQLADGCSIIPCTTIYINWLGFITIPLLAFVAFVGITILNLFLWKYSRKEGLR